MNITKKEGMPPMLIPTIIMAVIAIVLCIVASKQGPDQLNTGFKSALNMALMTLPLLLLAFLVAGMIQAVIPKETLARLIGAESGFKGILLGCLAGGIAPGGPYVSMPIAAALAKTGAGTGTMVGFITAWSLWAIARLPLEIGILGWKLTLARIASTFIFPPIAGYIAYLLFDKAK
jgi:uncharacterized membrane protein YraQ (UPF0718 family)